MLKEILQYQKLDASLIKLERELENSETKKVVNKMVDQVRQAQNKLVELEKSANRLLADYERLKQEFEKKRNRLENLKKVDFKTRNENELRENSKDIKQQIASLLSLNKEITALSKKIVTTLDDFNKTKAVGLQAKNRYAESIKNYNSVAGDKTHKVSELRAELKKLEQHIDPKVLNRYKSMRLDHKFPIFVPLVDNACGGCAMSLPTSRLDILNKQKILECENCHRMIYLPDMD